MAVAYTATDGHTPPEFTPLSDRELVMRILADPRRRAVVELLMIEMCLEGHQDRHNWQFQIVIAGRRVAVTPQGRMREVLLPKD